MSEIHFSADLDSKKLEDAIKQSNQTVKNWAKDVEKQGNVVDQGLNKTTKSFKDAIKEQQQLIKSIESDVKKLQKAYDDAGAGKLKSAAGGELGSAKRALAEEQARLSQLQKAQIEANKEEEGSISGLVGKLGKWVIGLASVGAVMKLFKSIIDSSDAATQKFERIIGGATAAMDYFFKSIASGDWTSFISGMNKAVEAGVKYVKVMDSIQNRRNENLIKESELDREIGKLREDTYDKDDENNLKRLQSLTRINELTRQKYDAIIKLDNDTFNASLALAASTTKLSEEKIKNLLHEYTSLEKVIEAGEEYNRLIKEAQGEGADVFAIEKQIELLGSGADKLGEYAIQVGKLSKQQRNDLSKMWAQINDDERAFDNESRRNETQRAATWNKMIDNWDKEIDEQNKNWEERNDLGKKITEQEKLLNDAIAEGNSAEIKATALRIAELKKELELREKLAKQIVDAVTYEGFVPTTIATRGFKTPSVIPKPKTETVQKTFDDLRKKMTELRPMSDALREQGEKTDKLDIKAGNKKIDNQKQLIAGASELIYLAGKQLGLGEEELKVLNDKLNIIGQFASGNYVGAAISTVISVVSSFMSLIPDQSEKLSAKIEQINVLLEEQQRLIDLSARKGGEQSARQKEIDDLNRLLDIQNTALDKAQKTLSGGDFWNTQAKMKKAEKTWNEMTAAIKETQNAIDDADQELKDFLRGGITENTIADKIAQGFREGKSSVTDFADFMNETLQDAVMKIFTADMLDSSEMKVYLDYLSKALIGGVIDEGEKNILKIYQNRLTEAQRKKFDAINTLGIGETTSTNAGLTAIVRNMTEETGNELTGLFRRFADDERVIKDYSKMGISHLVGIEANTYGSWQELLKINPKLDTIIGNIKQVPAGAL